MTSRIGTVSLYLDGLVEMFGSTYGTRAKAFAVPPRFKLCKAWFISEMSEAFFLFFFGALNGTGDVFDTVCGGVVGFSISTATDETERNRPNNGWYGTSAKHVGITFSRSSAMAISIIGWSSCMVPELTDGIHDEDKEDTSLKNVETDSDISGRIVDEAIRLRRMAGLGFKFSLSSSDSMTGSQISR